LVLTFQSASQALEKSYGDLQDRVRILTEDLERERGQRIRLERLAAMGEMAMELAHEIRNPLGSIELFASMLEGEYADQIVRSVRLLNHSVTNVLHFGRPIAPSPEQISVNTLLEGIRGLIQPLAAQKNIRLEVVCDFDCTLFADHELLHRMLLNLVLNALRETPTNGTIRVSAKHGVTISVEDSGPGIPEDAISRIFDPMFSTHREGCGLGLPIVKRIVDSHNGTIQVESTKSGTRFVITFLQSDLHNMEVVSEPLTCS
ncbi:MAG TPA: ATP-binding protein, partial [Terriglobia bacterium]|nr:ATP-binding protein [Terriglobia bacterium]